MSDQMNKLIKDLVAAGFKRYQLEVKDEYGRYFVTLPLFRMDKDLMKILIDIIPEDAIVGRYDNIFSGLVIDTHIPVDIEEY